ncbi:hypothetical protein PGQ11_009015 [Apiospora arundinis]|uniref:Uncharacterized protein n=1 Tax=Apiospora arundinis TaxID=335852 RepID=A0ABR2IGS5_9PEZI
MSFSLANRTKVVVPDLDGSLRSHQPSSGEGVYTYASQEGLAFNTPPAADACHFALSPEPIREEMKEEQPKPRQSSSTMARRKSSTNSSGDVATPPPPQAKKKKYTRAFSHRARTGCMTCR